MRVSNINRDILQQTAAQLDQATFLKFPKLDAWVEGSVHPTFNQIVKYAKEVDVPFGYFFLKEMPPPATSIPHYRTVKEGTYQPSANLLAVIDGMEQRQLWAKDLLLEWGAEPLEFAGKYTLTHNIEAVVEALYQLLNIKEVNWASRFPTWQKAFNFLIERTEAAGVFVVVNGVVGNNTHRPLQVEEFRGFVLYDEIAPFVFINGKDAVSAKIFTLVHELVHVLIGESASFDFSSDFEHTNEIERFCNQVAANFLVPEQLLKAYYDEVADSEQYAPLARKFKVSQLVVARRLLDTGIIHKAQFLAFYKKYTAELASNKKPSGGNFYNSVPYKVGRRFFDLVHTAMLQQNIQPTDAFRLTGLRAKTYEAYLKKQRGA